MKAPSKYEAVVLDEGRATFFFYTPHNWAPQRAASTAAAPTIQALLRQTDKGCLGKQNKKQGPQRAACAVAAPTICAARGLWRCVVLKRAPPTPKSLKAAVAAARIALFLFNIYIYICMYTYVCMYVYMHAYIHT